MSDLTPRQQKLMKFLIAYIGHHGVSPSYRECAVAIGTTSTSQVTYAMDTLVRVGFIKRGHKARTIELLPTKDHHAADCICGGCSSIRYLKSLKLIEALKVAPPAIIAGKLPGLRPPKVRPQPRVQVAQ